MTFSQARCASTLGCSGFAYEFEQSCVDETDPDTCSYYHECYVKSGYADDPATADVDEDAACNAFPYVVWSGVSMPHTVLECRVSEMTNSDTCPRFTTGADYASGAGDIQWHPASGPRACSGASTYGIDYAWTDISRTGTPSPGR